MIEIKVKLFATLKEFNPEQPDSKEPLALELTKGSTIADLYQKLDIPDDTVKMNFVNNKKKKADYQLQDGDKVALFPPIAGG